MQISDAGAPSLVAEIGAAVAEGGSETAAVSLAWDGAREVAWVACRAGLVALGRRHRH